MSIVSATKYYSGHSDVMGGSLAIKKDFKASGIKSKSSWFKTKP